MTVITEAIAALNGMTAYTLANMADTPSPDSPESVGAVFLSAVRDSVTEQLDYYFSGDYAEYAEDLPTFVDSIRELSTFSHEIPDAAPSIYTHERFQQLTDLCAYQEDVSEYGPASIEETAGYALYMVAERLVSALLDYVADFEPADAEDY